MPRQVAVPLPFEFVPRSYQQPVWKALFDTGSEWGDPETDINRAFLCDHRRSGKDLNLINLTNVKMSQRVGIYAHIFPTLVEGRRVIWKGMDKGGRRFLDYFPGHREWVNGERGGWIVRKREDDMSIELANGSTYQVLGADHPDALRGMNIIGAIFSEYAFFKGPDTWDIVRPMMSENGGWAAFATTPNGRNFSHSLHKAAEKLDDWYAETLPNSKTGVVSEKRIKADRDSGMSEEKIASEYECSYDASVDGAFYGKAMTDMQNDNRIGKFPHMPGIKVDTYWDIGVDDPTAVWFVQNLHGMHRCIDFEWLTGVGIPQFVTMLNGGKFGDRDFESKKKYNYGRHFGPFDLMVREVGADFAQTRFGMAAALGLNFTVVPRSDIEDGRNAVRALLATTCIDEDNCQIGLDGLRMYRRKESESGLVGPDGRPIYSNEHEHNWASHPADSMRTGAMGRAIFSGDDWDGETQAPKIAMV